MFKDFLSDGAEIYRLSGQRIAAAVDKKKWQNNKEWLVVERVVHAVGDPTIAELIFFSPQAAEKISNALVHNAPIICDSHMTRHGLIASRNEKISLVDDARVRDVALEKKITRSHAQIYLWQEMLGDDFANAIVVIGNAPTCLYALLKEWQENNFPQPAGMIAMPVGFVGASEAKQALIDFAPTLPFITITGTRGGSAMAAAATNALLSQKSIMEI